MYDIMFNIYFFGLKSIYQIQFQFRSKRLELKNE